MDYFYVAIADNYGVLGCWRNEADAEKAVLDHFNFHNVDIISRDLCLNNTWNSTAERVLVFTGKKKRASKYEVCYSEIIAQIDKRFIQEESK